MNEERLNSYDPLYQCEMDLEDNAQRSKSRDYEPRYTCAVCGAGAESMDSLCAPDHGRKRGA